MTLNYNDYLLVPELLELQVPRSDPAEHDETLFIIIHQTYELWFKQLLHEFEKIKTDFSAGDLHGAGHSLKRCRTIMKTLVGQMDILETMTPMSFTSFRDRLDDASGFQSLQFREFEFVLGYRRPAMTRYQNERGQEILNKRLAERSLYDHFYDLLETQGVVVPEELIERDLSTSNSSSTALQRDLLRVYKANPSLAGLFELMTDLDEGLMEWRYRHVMLVKRTIGEKKGTGGSLGVKFLEESLFLPAFPDLWEIRHAL